MFSSFAIKGFLHVKGFFEMSEIDELVSVLQKIEASEGVTLNDCKQLKNLQQRSFFSQFMESPKLIKLAEELLRHKVKPFRMHFRNSVPNSGGCVLPHQDASGPNLDPASAITFWIPLGDYRKVDGCLNYYSESHWNGLSPDLPKIGVPSVSPVCMEVEKGDLLAHHHFTIHYSGDNKGNRNRWALMLNYIHERAEKIPIERWREKYVCRF